MMRKQDHLCVNADFEDSEMNQLVMNTPSSKEQFDALMAEAEAEMLIDKFGSDEQLETRISREHGGSAGSAYC
jgi:hypothetical protein